MVIYAKGLCSYHYGLKRYWDKKKIDKMTYKEIMEGLVASSSLVKALKSPKSFIDKKLEEFDNLDKTHGRIAWEKSIRSFLKQALEEQKKEYEAELVRLRIYWKKRMEAK